MSWNYRLVRHEDAGGVTFGVHEAYYDKKGRIWAITEDAVGIVGDSPEDAKGVHSMMYEAWKRPVIEAKDVPQKGAVNPAAKGHGMAPWNTTKARR